MKKTKIITIKDYQNQGKTTTIWLLLKALIEDGAEVQEIYDLNHSQYIEIPNEMPPQELYDVRVILRWRGRVVVIIGRGDYADYLVADIQWALNIEPDFVVCAVQCRVRKNDKWDAFNAAFPNNVYARISFWVERAKGEKEIPIVAHPTIEAIMKYMA